MSDVTRYDNRPAFCLVPPALLLDRTIAPQARLYWVWLAMMQGSQDELVVSSAYVVRRFGVSAGTICRWSAFLRRRGYLQYKTLAGGRIRYCVQAHVMDCQ